MVGNVLRQSDFSQAKTKPLGVDTQRLLLPLLTVRLHNASASDRTNIESYIAAQFFDHYTATVNTFLPLLLSSQRDEHITAAVGFQLASHTNHLFLESYLDQAIEKVISSQMKLPIERDSIVEIGNLTSSRRGSSFTLFVLIAAILQKSGYQWVTFTANRQVQQILSKLQLSTQFLAHANQHRLADKGQSWGSYYNDNPVVLAGNLQHAVECFSRDKVISFLLESQQDLINTIADEVRP